MTDAITRVLSDRTAVFTILSPPGLVQFPHLVTPDTKFEPRFGFWSVRLTLDALDAVPVRETIRDGAAQALKLAPVERPAYAAELPYTLEQDGTCVLVLKAKAWPNVEPPRVFDTMGRAVSASFVKHGSLARVLFTIVPFCTADAEAGASLRLREVHLVAESR
jgi:hypothetical protein